MHMCTYMIGQSKLHWTAKKEETQASVDQTKNR